MRDGESGTVTLDYFPIEGSRELQSNILENNTCDGYPLSLDISLEMV